MTKKELIEKYDKLAYIKNVRLEGVGIFSKKEMIENAINCLECSDKILDKYLVIIELKYPNMHKEIIKSNFKTHSYNRILVFNTARRILNIN